MKYICANVRFYMNKFKSGAIDISVCGLPEAKFKAMAKLVKAEVINYKEYSWFRFQGLSIHKEE